MSPTATTRGPPTDVHDGDEAAIRLMGKACGDDEVERFEDSPARTVSPEDCAQPASPNIADRDKDTVSRVEQRTEELPRSGGR